jgi:uncharacterized protein involved in exopolysaccharide biosynthesis
LSFTLQVWAARHVVAVVVVCAGVVGLALAFLIPAKYEATALILPGPESRGLSSMIGNLGSLAGVAGVNLGDSDVDLYPAVARSHRVLERVLALAYRDETLAYYLNGDLPADSLDLAHIERRLRASLAADKDLRSGALTLRFRHRDPDLAAFLINGVLAELDGFFRERSGSELRHELRVLEGRLQKVADELRCAEESLRDFRNENRHLAHSAALQLAEGRLARDVEIKSRVYVELVTQQELLKLRAAGEPSVVRVLDRAQVPLVKAWPRRTHVVLVAVFAGVLGVLAWIRFRQWRHERDAAGTVSA